MGMNDPPDRFRLVVCRLTIREDHPVNYLPDRFRLAVCRLTIREDPPVNDQPDRFRLVVGKLTIRKILLRMPNLIDSDWLWVG